MSLACGALADGLHFAEVEALDSEALWRGPIFRVPVTVVKPTACGPPPPSASTTLPRTRLEPPIPPHVALFPSLAFTAGREHRHFVAVPEGATWCEMKLTSASDGCTNPRGYIVRATQLRPAQSFSDNEGVRAFLQLGAGQDWNRAFPVYGDTPFCRPFLLCRPVTTRSWTSHPPFCPCSSVCPTPSVSLSWQHWISTM